MEKPPSLYWCIRLPEAIPLAGNVWTSLKPSSFWVAVLTPASVLRNTLFGSANTYIQVTIRLGVAASICVYLKKSNENGVKHVVLRQTLWHLWLCHPLTIALQAEVCHQGAKALLPHHRKP